MGLSTSHLSKFGTHTLLKAAVYTNKIQVNSGIFHDIPLESVAYSRNCYLSRSSTTTTTTTATTMLYFALDTKNTFAKKITNTTISREQLYFKSTGQYAF